MQSEVHYRYLMGIGRPHTNTAVVRCFAVSPATHTHTHTVH